MTLIHSNRFTDSYTKRPQPQGIAKFLIKPSADELARIKAGYGQAFCYEHDLPDVTRKAAEIAANIGAKSWTMFPMLEDAQRRLIVEYYNWPETGIYNFDNPFRSNKKKYYWWFNAKLPEWWDNPDWKHVAEEHEKPYDPRD